VREHDPRRRQSQKKAIPGDTGSCERDPRRRQSQTKAIPGDQGRVQETLGRIADVDSALPGDMDQDCVDAIGTTCRRRCAIEAETDRFPAGNDQFCMGFFSVGKKQTGGTSKCLKARCGFKCKMLNRRWMSIRCLRFVASILAQQLVPIAN
jgi:hypothetical protein